MRFAVMAMTGLVFGSTIYEAAFGNNFWLVLSGTCLSIFGVIVGTVVLGEEATQ